MSRFKKSKEEEKILFAEASTAVNTKHSTNTWVNVFNAMERGYDRKIYDYNPQELGTMLQSFYIEVRKQNGQEYEPQCLNIMITALDRYLKDNEYKFSICLLYTSDAADE